VAALATVADLEVRLGRVLDGDETARAEALLDGASARVRASTGQQFAAATDTARLRVRNGVVRLPQRPATAVTAVEDVAGNSLDFTWHAGQTFTLGTTDRFDLEPLTGDRWVDVTYTAGYAAIPDDVIEVVCQMVLRTFGVAAEASGYDSESIGSYSYSVGAVAAAGAVGMMNEERAALDHYRRKGGTIRVS
jgi:hypothetical protein